MVDLKPLIKEDLIFIKCTFKCPENETCPYLTSTFNWYSSNGTFIYSEINKTDSISLLSEDKWSIYMNENVIF